MVSKLPIGFLKKMNEHLRTDIQKRFGGLKYKNNLERYIEKERDPQGMI
jgi:hypothetical protein